MEDVHVSTDSPGTVPPAQASPAATTSPKQRSPMNQAKDSAKKVLAIITGRPSR